MKQVPPEIVMIETERLIPYAMNSRTHSPEQVAQIAASIKEFGFTNPVLTDGDNGIIAGHGRVMAAQKLQLEYVPCIELPYLTEAQRKAYVIADNKLALNAGWDFEMLNIEIEELKDLDFDIDLLGFDTKELDNLFGNEDRSKKYTNKIASPVYEMKGEEPEISDLYDTTKTGELSKLIMEIEMPDDIRGFLMAAATRHTVFDYENIAEFYAHQPAEIQILMQKSALVIIDFDSAIENGFVILSESIEKIKGECKVEDE